MYFLFIALGAQFISSGGEYGVMAGNSGDSIFNLDIFSSLEESSGPLLLDYKRKSRTISTWLTEAAFNHPP